MKLLSIGAAALLLTACTNGHIELKPFAGVRTDEAIHSPVIRTAYYNHDELALRCYRNKGWFTHDGVDCFIETKAACLYLTAPNDAKHDRELTAMCNGWRLKPIVRLW